MINVPSLVSNERTVLYGSGTQQKVSETKLLGHSIRIKYREISPSRMMPLPEMPVRDEQLMDLIRTQIQHHISDADVDLVITTSSWMLPVLLDIPTPSVLTRSPSDITEPGDSFIVTTFFDLDATPKRLSIRQEDIELIRGKRVALVNPVFRTGRTETAVREALHELGAELVCTICVFHIRDRMFDTVDPISLKKLSVEVM